ncbi:hypothetical protein RQP46_008684 [Phenoliferia psychrophenolica]
MSDTDGTQRATASASTATSISEQTAADHNAVVNADEEKAAGKSESTRTGIFSEPGTLPVPYAGHHHLGVVFEGLTVLGTGGAQRTVEGLEISLFRAFDFFSFVKKLTGWKTGPTRPLISDFWGVVPDGETCLVLGRPGAGCSTLLRAIANQRAPFVRVEGDVHYSTITAKEAKKFFDGEILFNSEVEQTLDTALTLKKPHKLQNPMTTRAYVADYTNRLLNTFGMPHTRKTFVGNDFVRGVSGGERKRVSLSEMLTTNASLICWDNSIRGLDSAVALHYLKALKELSRSTGITNVVSIYQASQASHFHYPSC